MQPQSVFDELAKAKLSPVSVFFKVSVWLSIAPPIFAYLGASRFGWRLGAVEPLFLPPETLLKVSLSYLAALLIGFFSTAIISRWMAVTYGARNSLGIHFAMISIVGAPLAVGSIIHLYPDVFINILVLVPVLIWCMYLLYRGLPVILATTPERGMLMASSLIGFLLVAMVSLLGITVFLWINGVGPALGI